MYVLHILSSTAKSAKMFSLIWPNCFLPRSRSSENCNFKSLAFCPTAIRRESTAAKSVEIAVKTF
jgi:hypothetical protein